MYEEKQIDGKGDGCVATENIKIGSLIFSEKPLLLVDSFKCTRNPKKRNQLIFVAFSKLTPENKQKYLSLDFHNTCSVKYNPRKKEVQDLANSLGVDPTKVINIFETNRFNNGIFLKMSKLNHACIPNAECIWNPETGAFDLRAMKAKLIMKGEEITMSYIGLKYRDRNERRAELKRAWNFHCMCAACDISDAEAKAHKQICNKIKSISVFESNIGDERREVNNLKETYKLAKSMNTIRKSYILHCMLLPGFNIACQGATMDIFKGSTALSNEFMQDAESFANAGIILSKRMYGDSHGITQDWIRRKEDTVLHFSSQPDEISMNETR